MSARIIAFTEISKSGLLAKYAEKQTAALLCICVNCAGRHGHVCTVRAIPNANILHNMAECVLFIRLPVRNVRLFLCY